MGSMIETQTDQERAMRLCPSCGKALSKLCSKPKCGRPLSASFRICPFCGTEASGPPATEHGETPVPTGIRVRTFRGPCYSMGASPDGSLLAACLGTDLYVFETATGRVVRRLSRDGRPGSNMYSIDFFPDGGRILAADISSIMAWDFFSGELLHFTGRDAEADRASVGVGAAMSPDGSRLLIPGEEAMILWDTVRWCEIGRKPYGKPAGAKRISRSVGGTFLGERHVVWIENQFCDENTPNVARQWDFEKGTVTDIFSFTSRCSSNPVSWSQDARVCAVSLGYEVAVYACPEGKLIARVQNVGAWVSSVRLSSSGKRLLVGSHHGVVLFCDTATGRALWRTQAYKGKVEGLVFVRGESLFASCGGASEMADGTRGELILWTADPQNYKGWEHLPERMEGSHGWPGHQVVSRTSRTESSASLREPRFGKELDGGGDARLCPYCSRPQWKLCPNPDCQRALDESFSLCPSCGTKADDPPEASCVDTSGPAPAPRLLDRTTLEPEGRLITGGIRIRSFEGDWRCLDVSPDGTLIAGAATLSTWLFDAGTGRVLRKLTRTSGSAIRSVQFGPYGKQVIAADASSIAVWDLHSGELLEHLRLGHSSNTGVAISPDGQRMLVPGEGSMALWDTDTWREERSCDLEKAASGPRTVVHSCLFLGPDRVAWVEERRMKLGWEADVKEWSFGSSQPVIVLSNGVCQNTSRAAWSQDRSRVAMSGVYHGIAVRECRDGRVVAELPGLGHPSCMRFSPSGNSLLVGYEEHELRLWDIDSQRVVWCSSEHTGRVADISFVKGNTVIASCGPANGRPVGRNGELFIWRVRA